MTCLPCLWKLPVGEQVVALCVVAVFSFAAVSRQGDDGFRAVFGSMIDEVRFHVGLRRLLETEKPVLPGFLVDLVELHIAGFEVFGIELIDRGLRGYAQLLQALRKVDGVSLVDFGRP